MRWVCSRRAWFSEGGWAELCISQTPSDADAAAKAVLSSALRATQLPGRLIMGWSPLCLPTPQRGQRAERIWANQSPGLSPMDAAWPWVHAGGL